VKIEVHFALSCKHCDRTARSVGQSSLQDHIRPLEADPAWRVLVEFLLLHLTSTIGSAVGGDCSSLSEFEGSPRCLQGLTKALQRQQRHLAEMGSARTPKMIVDPNILVTHEKIVTNEGVWVCPDCGNPTRLPAWGPTSGIQ
jgi:hypothetical protein